jgi:hypothetical protein
MIAFLGITGALIAAAVGGLICGVLFNKPIRVGLQQVPLIGKYF